MSEALVASGPVKRFIFGDRLLVPADAAVQVSVGVTRPFGTQPRGKPSAPIRIGYTVGVEFTVSHAHFRTRSIVFSPRTHRLSFEVETAHPYSFAEGGNARALRSENAHIAPILSGMEDLALKDYLTGELSFESLRTFFWDEYQRRSGSRAKRSRKKH